MIESFCHIHLIRYSILYRNLIQWISVFPPTVILLCYYKCIKLIFIPSSQWRRYTRAIWPGWKIHCPGSSSGFAVPSSAYCFVSVIVWIEIKMLPYSTALFYFDGETALAACVLTVTSKKRSSIFFKEKVHPGDLAGRFSDLKMTWLLYCAGAATAFPFELMTHVGRWSQWLASTRVYCTSVTQLLAAYIRTSLYCQTIFLAVFHEANLQPFPTSLSSSVADLPFCMCMNSFNFCLIWPVIVHCFSTCVGDSAFPTHVQYSPVAPHLKWQQFLGVYVANIRAFARRTAVS